MTFIQSVIHVIQQYWPSFCQALLVTIQMTVFSLIFATIIGTVFGLFGVSKSRPLKWLANLYVDIIRGTPLLVQIFIMYYGFTQLLGFKWPQLGPFAPSFVAGVFTLSINAGAYMAEIVRGGIESIDKGQMEAARSLGLPYGRAMIKVILPQAFRTMLPSIINQFIISLKDTSLISIIGPRELTQNGKILAANNSVRVMAIWIVVALFYLVVCTVLSRVAKLVERRSSYGK